MKLTRKEKIFMRNAWSCVSKKVALIVAERERVVANKVIVIKKVGDMHVILVFLKKWIQPNVLEHGAGNDPTIW